ncbi:MAG TPA: hypothetical protein VFT50_15710 [Baekduia sp.]|nr:hypothetical protein [Baekduia sp.]
MSHRGLPRAAVALLGAVIILVLPATAGAKRHGRALPTRVAVELLPESTASVSIPAIPLPGGAFVMGTEDTNPRTVPLSGGFSGAIAGGFLLSKTNKVALRSGRVDLGAADLLADADCGGASVLRLDPASAVTLDRSAPSTARITPKGIITATVHLVLRLAVGSRVLPRCDAGLVSMGYATTPFTLKLHGDVTTAGLNKVLLTTDAPAKLTAAVCLDPGSPTSRCNMPPVGYPVSVGAAVAVKLSITG